MMNTARDIPPPASDDWAAALPPSLSESARAQAARRHAAHAPALHAALGRLYGDLPGHNSWLADLMRDVGALHAARPAALRALDAAREMQPDWFCAPDMLGYCCYADRFGGTLRGVADRVDYLAELGVRYLHLLPFLRARSGDNDGGFAVASFDEVEPALGSNADLEQLCARLRGAGISLCADLVLNHVADDHPWARGAAAGDAALRDYFHVLPSGADVARHEATLNQVFPLAAPGNFTHVPAMGGWVWTTFYPYQWDLNYRNPQVFASMMLALLKLANRGIEVFRLDSIAYLWKREGGNCMNEPEVHLVLQAMRALVAIAAPGVLLKAEAIVPTAALPAYFGNAAGPTCQLAYHSTLMAAGWAALAEQDSALLRAVIAATPALPPAASWLTYVRCHDDIGWRILLPEAGAQPRLDAVARFFTGADGAYPRGVPFQAGASGAPAATNGMAAALAGIDPQRAPEVQRDALARMLLVYGLALAFGGLPVLYMGDELGMGNDPRFDSAGNDDTRWVQRPPMDESRLAERQDNGTVAGRMFNALRGMAAVRASLPALAAHAPRRLLPCADPAVLAFERGARFLFIANFSGREALLNAAEIGAPEDRKLAPWSMMWLQRRPRKDGTGDGLELLNTAWEVR